MGLESFICNWEQNFEKMRSNQAANFEKAFQSLNFNEGVKARHITTINEGMAGQSVNGVKFAKRVFTLNGEKVEGVFPVFQSVFQCKLPETLYQASDNTQMKFCTKKLADRVECDPNFRRNFTPRQLEQIKNGEPKISGLTWHHNELPGKMQLVKESEHSAARHTGGRSLWGGGSDNR